MSPFIRKAPEPEPPRGGGLNVLRARAKAHARSTQGHSWLKDVLHLSADSLDAFLNGGPLAMPKVGLLIDYLGMRCEYLPDLDLLRSTVEPASFMGNPPDRYVPPATVDVPRAGPAFSPETPLGAGMLKPASLCKPQGWA
jgi:hypothetical protein